MSHQNKNSFFLYCVSVHSEPLICIEYQMQNTKKCIAKTADPEQEINKVRASSQVVKYRAI